MSSIPESNLILGVEFKALKSHGDERGFFREIIRSSDKLFEAGVFGQWSHSLMQRNVVKAWHYHHVQYDWWYVPIGQVQTVLFDNREESPTFKRKLVFKMGQTAQYGADTFELCVRIPPGVLHGLRVLSEEAHLFYITSMTYDPEEEGRIPFDSEVAGHDWGASPIVVENDRRFFVPKRARQRLR
ncbi:MAG: dTDP-4-dehydrorhamnose 3,5-epimerase family protein [Oligoflexia bacterium]|nr:dTDP-4-dehydrorhamnose 3,5-epimerase family protein [Oligoflexia bacterium]